MLLPLDIGCLLPVVGVTCLKLLICDYVESCYCFLASSYEVDMDENSRFDSKSNREAEVLDDSDPGKYL